MITAIGFVVTVIGALGAEVEPYEDWPGWFLFVGFMLFIGGIGTWMWRVMP